MDNITFSIEKSFWAKLNPLSWSKRTVLTGLLVFYALFVPIYLYYGFQPSATADSVSAIDIPAVSISEKITDVILTGSVLPTPVDTIGRYIPNTSKTFLFGHSTTVFKNLKNISLEDELLYESSTYEVVSKEILPVSEIDMSVLLRSTDEKTLVLMTCSGEERISSDGSTFYPDRLIITATEKVQK